MFRAVLLLLPALVFAADESNLQARLQAKLDEMRAASGVAGVSAAIVLGDGKLRTAVSGLADVETKTPLTLNHRMLAGSIGKTFVAAYALDKVQKGKLGLDDKIEKYLGGEPWFARLPNARTITIRQLMNHTSGIKEHVTSPEFTKALRENPEKVWTPVELVGFALDTPALFPAGTDWAYADTNYVILGVILEKITGKPLFAEIDREIVRTYRLTRTLPSDQPSIPEMATGYSRPNSPFGYEGPVIMKGKFRTSPQMEYAGGGFASTAYDLARWAKMIYDNGVITESMRDEMLKGVPAKTGRGDKYGLGVQIRESPFGISYGHGGWYPGYLSEMEYFADSGAAIAIQFNSDDIRGKLKRPPRAWIFDIARLFLDEKPAK